MSDKRYIPNSFQTPNVLIDEIMPFLTPEEWVILSFAVRHILGWQDKIASQQANISLSRFENTGLSRPAIIKALAELERFGLLAKIGVPSDKGQCWQLSFDENVKSAAMHVRRFDQDKQNKRRTDKARSVRFTSQSDLLVLVSPTDQQVVSATDTRKHKETQVTNTLSAPDGEGVDHEAKNLSMVNRSNSNPVELVLPKPKTKMSKEKQPPQYGDLVVAIRDWLGIAVVRVGPIAKALLKDFPDIMPDEFSHYTENWNATKGVLGLSKPCGTNSLPISFGAWRKENPPAPPPAPKSEEELAWDVHHAEWERQQLEGWI